MIVNDVGHLCADISKIFGRIDDGRSRIRWQTWEEGFKLTKRRQKKTRKKGSGAAGLKFPLKPNH